MENVAETAAALGRIDPPDAAAYGGGAASLRQTLSNLAIAGVFLLALLAHARNYHSLSELISRAHHYDGLADLVWMIGAGLMGILSLIRVAPSSTMVNVRSVAATAAMMVAPAFLRAQSPSTGILAASGLVIEFIGIMLSEGSRVYLGRRFGFLPANRGIVTTGPFRLVRHPIYAGWFILSFGLLMVYPIARNALILAITLPVMIYRIDLEEQLLAQDPGYRDYCELTRSRLIPFVY